MDKYLGHHEHVLLLLATIRSQYLFTAVKRALKNQFLFILIGLDYVHICIVVEVRDCTDRDLRFRLSFWNCSLTSAN